MDPLVCSSAGRCQAEGDIWDAPDGRVGLNFDDGPSFGTTSLLDFLESVNQTATMYLIGEYFDAYIQHSEFNKPKLCAGGNILQWPQQTIRAFEDGHELSVHTWSHPKMTSQTDYGILVELGWTMQVRGPTRSGRHAY